MTPNDFTAWFKQISSLTINWPKNNKRLLDDDPAIVNAFFASLKLAIEEWMTSKQRIDLPKLINKTLDLSLDFSTPYGNKSARNLIVMIIEKGNHIGLWNLTVPELSILSNRQRSPFQPSELTNYADFQDIFYQHLQNIKTNKHKNLELEAGIGCALFSCAYFGGLIRVDLWQGLIEHMKNYKHTKRDAWIDFYDNQAVYFRWHPDPISEMLLSEYLLNNSAFQDKKNIKEELLEYMNVYLSTFAPENNLTSLNFFFRAVQIHFHLNLPEAVAYYLTKPFHSTPLPTNAWLRYRGLAVEKSVNEPAKECVTDIHKIEPYRLKSIDVLAKDQNKIFNLFRKYVFNPTASSGKKDSRNAFYDKCMAFLKQHNDDMTQAMFFFIQWLAHRVRGGIAISSARTYTSHLKPVILGLLNVDFKSIEGDDLLDCYNSILRETNLRSTGNHVAQVASMIKSYHTFLFLYADASEIAFGELMFNIEDGKTLARANILSNDEILQIQQSLQHDPRMRFVFLLAVRLGLRMKEICHLQFRSFVGWEKGFDLFVFIITSEFHDNKTVSAKRMISLKKHLPDDEYQQFVEFYTNQRKIIGNIHSKKLDSTDSHSEYLLASKKHFIFSTTSASPLTRVEIDREVVPVIRNITGDHSLAFHSLRHSFVNHALLNLLLDESNLKRDTLMSFSYEIGHLTPEETLKSYFHLMPVVAKYYLNRNLSNLLQLSAPKASELFGYSDTKIIKRIHKAMAHNPFMLDALISYYREDNLSAYREVALKQNLKTKITVKNNDSDEWMHPKLLFSCINSDQNDDFYRRLSHVNSRPDSFYYNIKKIKNAITTRTKEGARGLTWPKDTVEEKTLFDTYRGIEALTCRKRSEFQKIYRKNIDKKNRVYQTNNIQGAIKYCQFLQLIFGNRQQKNTHVDILIRLYPDTRIGAQTPEVQAQTWLKKLRDNQINVRKVLINSSDNAVQTVTNARSHVSGKVSITINDGHNMSSHGFKMGIVLALSYAKYLL
jgi:site-specific recombinase XerD